ncbi:hypothetical protein [Mesobacillus subterraneus]|uniref:Uncharacterized protein n=1 Tax=Mesobacillus subterraneus TaxID=285983 RepID=A0A3R9FHP9_9BACI|nr:hypothetical protein [Mesobacillus subterraneus]RSD28266.1 hypothetical protein EJA10_07380 [Mesobacillus subterraneus]
MQKLLMLTFVLLLVFSGSVIASPSSNGSSNAVTSPIEAYKSESEVNTAGYLCWQCTKWAYYNGYRTCVSGVWLTSCPVAG